MPSPISIWPYAEWLGNDGNWSTFPVAIGVGDSRQPVNLLPATSGSGIWPVHLQGCSSVEEDSQYVSDPEGCPASRGGLFDPTTSSFMQINASNGYPFLVLPFSDGEQAIGFEGNAVVGKDRATLGTASTAVLLDDVTIAAFPAKLPFLGLLGLSGYANHVRRFNDTDKTPLQMLEEQDIIPSNYYGYTAGARYRGDTHRGSLTFGGYDSARGSPDDGIQVPTDLDSQRDLLVEIRNVTIGEGSASTTTRGPAVKACIDSIVTEIWLPTSFCEAFETAFELEWNDTVKYYLVSEEQHQRMLSQNKSVYFAIAADGSAEAKTIEMPYAAFDHSLRYPLANITDGDASLRYFPLRRAADEAETFLGRTFLQEAYLTVDYDKRIFTVSQAKFPDSINPSLVCVGCKISGLGTGAIAGIAVAGAAVVIGIALMVLFWWRRSRKRKVQKLRSGLTSRASIGGTTIQEDDQNCEFFKPPPNVNEEEMKAELEGNNSAPGGFVSYGRHELASSGTVRRTSQQSGLSRNTAGISPIRHSRGLSYGSNGAPSPNTPGGSPSPGRWSGGGASPSMGSPQMRELQHHSSGHWYFELSGDPRAQDIPLPMSPQSPRAEDVPLPLSPQPPHDGASFTAPLVPDTASPRTAEHVTDIAPTGPNVTQNIPDYEGREYENYQPAVYGRSDRAN